MKPGFLIIGAQKSGTTSLADSLGRHPGVFICEPREPEYFARCGKAGEPGALTWDEYQGLFAGLEDGMMGGEASTGTMLSPATMAEIDARLPEVKLIAVLREPAGRAYSGFTHDMKKGRVGTEDGGELFRREAGKYLRGEECAFDWFARSEYGRQLEPFFQHYGPRLKVVIFEEFLRDQEKTFAEILDFLGLPPEPLELTRENQSRVPKGALTEKIVALGRSVVGPLRRSLGEKGYRRFREHMMKGLGKRAEPLDPALAAKLREEGFRRDVGKLEALLGRAVEVWR